MNRFVHPIIVILFFCGVSLLLPRPVIAQETSETAAQLKKLLDEKRSLIIEYEKNKGELDQSLQKVLGELGDSIEDQVKRREIFAQVSQQQATLRVEFQSKLKAIQRQERKLRYGREEVHREVFQYDSETLNYYETLDLEKRQNAIKEKLKNQKRAAEQQIQPQKGIPFIPRERITPSYEPRAVDPATTKSDFTNPVRELPPPGALFGSQSTGIKPIKTDHLRIQPAHYKRE